MKNLNMKNLSVVGVTALAYLYSVSSVFAVWTASGATTSVEVDSSLGDLSSLDSVLIFVANLLKYVGWAGVIIAILAVIGLLIFKLIGEDSENTMKTVQGGITKAVIIALLGLLLLSAGFFITFVGSIVGDSSRTVYSGQ